MPTFRLKCSNGSSIYTCSTYNQTIGEYLPKASSHTSTVQDLLQKPQAYNSTTFKCCSDFVQP